ncbi:hypothetical protein L842_1798 [Mycobacterium intracellulare MIN_052511_1280]|nr:hypothetical protein L842_1798 [Mycobacterium intracellulare MIN_052511_1280]
MLFSSIDCEPTSLAALQPHGPLLNPDGVLHPRRCRAVATSAYCVSVAMKKYPLVVKSGYPFLAR